MLIFYSINKEDIGFAKVRLNSLMTTAVKGDEVSAQSLKSDDLDLRGRGYRAASPTRPQFQNSYKMRGLRWAVNFPAAAEPFLLGENPGAWANTTRSVAQATVGIVVGPVFSIPVSGKLVTIMPDKLLPNSASLGVYADHGLEVILSIGPWVGSPAGG